MRSKVYSAVLICGLGLGSSLFASDVLVEVNGNKITKSDVNNFIKANQPVWCKPQATITLTIRELNTPDCTLV